VIQRVSVDVIRPLRRVVLRPGLPIEESAYAEDDLPSTVHLAAYAGDGGVVGCVTVFPEPHDGVADAWRLRGMATTPEVRGTGVGARLLAAAVDAARAVGASLLWCNAREPAEGFYARHGFVAVGELFDVGVIGPHRLMRLALERPAAR
jgi:predicted GNAT family N-acyltransferase